MPLQRAQFLFFFFFVFKLGGMIILPAQPQDTVFFSFPLYSSYSAGDTGRVLYPCVKGHVGVTGVNNLISQKNASTTLNYVALTRDLYICYSLTFSTKVMGIENHPGSFGSQGSKGHFHQKCFNTFKLRSIDT